MPKGMQAIYTQTVGAGGTTGVVFNNIPQTYTDLLVMISARDSNASGNALAAGMFFNGAGGTTLYSNLVTRNLNSSSNSFAATNFGNMYSYVNGNGTTSNTFSLTTHYIPNYTLNSFKQIITDTVVEGNVAGFDSMNFTIASLFRGNAPVTSITFSAAGNGFMQHSTFTLYGISR